MIGDHHLIDGHDAVVDADQDAGKVGGGKYRDRNSERQIAADQRQSDGQKDDRPRMARKPVRRLFAVGGHLLFVSLAGISRGRRFGGGLVASLL